jgi:hypothetical protein
MTNIKVNVRWIDGYYESFDCTEVRFGLDLLWMMLNDNKNRHIPLRNVRWFSVTPVSRETTWLVLSRNNFFFQSFLLSCISDTCDLFTSFCRICRQRREFAVNSKLIFCVPSIIPFSQYWIFKLPTFLDEPSLENIKIATF